MDVNASVIAAQTSMARQNAALGFIKSNAENQSQIANVVAEAADQGAAAASGGRGSIVNISV